MKSVLRDQEYLNFIRSRLCSFCGRPNSDPHHAIRNLKGLSEAGMGLKGSDYLAIPVCREDHRKIHDGKASISPEEILKICVINLTSYISQLTDPSLGHRINAKRQENQKSEGHKDRNET